MNKSRLRLEFYIIISIAVIVGAFFIVRLPGEKNAEGLPGETVTIALCNDYHVDDYDTNYFTNFIEEKTGYNINFVYMDEGLEEEYISSVLNSKNGSIDAIFLPSNKKVLSNDSFREYIDANLICSIESISSEANNLVNLREKYPEIDYSNITDNSGGFFAYPYIDLSAKARNLQIMWINVDWLKRLKLAIPKTADELENTLRLFNESDPNGDGLHNEIPILSVSDSLSGDADIFIKNAFTYYNPITEYIDNQGELELACDYIERLKKDELIVSLDGELSDWEMKELINSPNDLVGAFASSSISSVVYTDNPEVMGRFIQLPPISATDGGQGFAIKIDPRCEIGGFIPANSRHKKEAAAIMDLMLSQEAGLVAKYGEEGVDWHWSNDGEFTPFGMKAVITTENYLDGVVQNKNYAMVGPFALDFEYLDLVAWNGEHSFAEYTDICAVNIYEKYYKK